MPIRNVTKKRKGKASTRKTSAQMTRAIQVMRGSFFIIIGLVIVFLYFSFENGSLIEGLQSMNLAGLFQAGIGYIQENPLKIVIFSINNLILFWAGYVIGKKRRSKE